MIYYFDDDIDDKCFYIDFKWSIFFDVDIDDEYFLVIVDNILFFWYWY